MGNYEWLGIAHDKLLVTYLLITRNQMTRRTSIWQVEGDTWKILFYQVAPVQS